MKNIKMLIVGFIVGVVCATATGAYAAAGDQVEAIFADFNFIINGKSVTLDETPLVYNGTSYLPVRSLSNALGLDVTYKADSRTIVLSKDSVSGSTYGNGSSSANPTPSPTTSVVSPAPTSGSVGVDTTTTVGGNKMTSDGLAVVSLNGADYVSVHDASLKYPHYALKFNLEKNVVNLVLLGNDNDTAKYQMLSNDVPYYVSNGSSYILASDYENVILPLEK